MEHDKQILSKLVNDPNFTMTDAAEAWDCCRSVAINKTKRVALEVLRDKKWKV